MKTAYEAIYILDVNQPEEQIQSIIAKYREILERNGAEVDDTDRWEPRRLAYEVKGRREGIYIIVNFRSEPAAKDELDRIFRISDDALRFLIVKQSEKADRHPSQSRAVEQERREREAAARAAVAPPVEETPVTELAAPSAPETESAETAPQADGE
jgi:small subunit ribosomal protein S6